MIIKNNTSGTIVLDRNVTDLIRFLSCIMIALHHFSQYMCVQGTGSLIYKFFSSQGGWLGVAIFFFLSGYGLMKSDQKKHLDTIPFIKRRLLKVYLPAVVVSFIWSLYKYINKPELDINIIQGILGLYKFNDGVLWFIRAIICLYAFFYLYSILRLRCPNTRCRYAILSFITIISTCVLYYFKIAPYTVHALSVPFFFIGMSLADFPEQYHAIVQRKYPVILMLSCITIMAILFRHNAIFVHASIDYLAIISGITVFSCYNISSKRMPSWLSEYSFDIYLVHYKALNVLKPLFVVVPLWAFTALTLVFSFLFFCLRKILRL